MSVTFQCPCKATTFVAKGDPIACLFCWCNSCQRSISAPVEALGLWMETQTEETGELVQVRVTEKINGATRFSCAKCGTRMCSKVGGMVALFPAQAEDKSWFKPTAHIYVEDAGKQGIQPAQIKDGLPKFVNTPKAFGGDDRLIEAEA
ncbi:Mss4-like protein [Hyaloraphidium curvatum]|nr:Mss4-like protein [Hyaloraphidium curvatum]